MKYSPLKIGVVVSPDAPVYCLSNWVQFDNSEIYWRPLLQGVQAEAATAGVELIFSRQSAETYQTFAETEQVDALLLLTFGLSDVPVLQELTASGTPYVAVGVSAPATSEIIVPCVEAANADGGRIAARHLVGLGHRRLGCVNLAGEYVNHCDRMHGFIDEVGALGVAVDFDSVLIDMGYAFRDFEEKIKGWLERLRSLDKVPTAIFACDYLMARSTLDALGGLGLDVPGTVSVIGFDDPPTAADLEPPLTTIRQPVEAMGRRAVARIVEAFSDVDHRRPIGGMEILPTELVIRESTAAPA